MNFKKHKFQLCPIAAMVLVIAGCAPQMHKPSSLCPGKNSTAQALSILKFRSQNAVPLRANGQCRLHYYVDQKLRKENFPVKLWLNPPSEIYLQGDIAFDPRAIVAGLNEDEFWLAIKLKEVSTYWWGIWPGWACTESLNINPKLLLEAFGATQLGDEQYWSLSNEDNFDVLTKHNGKGMVIKRLYIDSCDYLVRRIEYFNADGQTVVVAEMDKYKQTAKDFFVPGVIEVILIAGDKDKEAFRIVLDSVKPAVFSNKQHNILFNRPKPQGFEHIYKIAEDDSMIEQTQ